MIIWINIVVKGWGLQACSYICDKQRCSQGQNPKAKDEAKAMTHKAEAEAWTLEAKTKDTNLCPRGSSRPRPVLENYITDYIATFKLSKMASVYCTVIPTSIACKPLVHVCPRNKCRSRRDSVWGMDPQPSAWKPNTWWAYIDWAIYHAGPSTSGLVRSRVSVSSAQGHCRHS